MYTKNIHVTIKTHPR